MRYSDGNVGLLMGWLVHDFGLERHIPTTIAWTAMKLCTDVRGPKSLIT